MAASKEEARFIKEPCIDIGSAQPQDTPAHNEIYLLYACDQWKGRDSMRLVSAGTDRESLYSAILNELYEGRMDFDGSSGTAAVARFREAYRSGFLNLAAALEYGHTDQMYNEANFIPGQTQQRDMLYRLLHMDDEEFTRTFPVVSAVDEAKERLLQDVLNAPEPEDGEDLEL